MKRESTFSELKLEGEILKGRARQIKNRQKQLPSNVRLIVFVHYCSLSLKSAYGREDSSLGGINKNEQRGRGIRRCVR